MGVDWEAGKGCQDRAIASTSAAPWLAIYTVSAMRYLDYRKLAEAEGRRPDA
jgi:hypothetical protein